MRTLLRRFAGFIKGRFRPGQPAHDDNIRAGVYTERSAGSTTYSLFLGR